MGYDKCGQVIAKAPRYLYFVKSYAYILKFGAPK